MQNLVSFRALLIPPPFLRDNTQKKNAFQSLKVGRSKMKNVKYLLNLFIQIAALLLLVLGMVLLFRAVSESGGQPPLAQDSAPQECHRSQRF
jgi:hypothetical protein